MALLSEYKTALYNIRSGKGLNYQQAKLFCKKRFFDTLLRADHVTNNYEQHTAKVLMKYNTLTDYILHTVFGYPSQLNSCGKIVVEIPTNAGSEIRLVENDFPYNYTDEVKQFVLWSLKKLTIKDTEEFIRNGLASLGYEEYCWAINEVFQTIPVIWHVHVFAKVPILP